jgi:Skp family chaperone for outer membrane proteins
MRFRTLVVCCLATAIVWSLAYEYCFAQQKATQPTLRIGVVSIREVFRDCKRNVKYRTEAVAEQSKLRAEMDDLAKEVERDEAELKTLKSGTAEHLAQIKQVLDKRAKLESQQEYYKQQRSLKDKQWTEDLFKEVLAIIKDLARQKGLDVVLERTEPEFPFSGEELMMVLNTYKVLYSGGCVDLSKEVLARLDQKDTAQ